MRPSKFGNRTLPSRSPRTGPDTPAALRAHQSRVQRLVPDRGVRPAPDAEAAFGLGAAVDAGAAIDGLTGLPAAEVLAQRIQQAIEESERDRTEVALLVLGMDGFRTVNAAYGREAGDALLGQIAARLSACIRQYRREGLFDALSGERPGDCVVRLRADEFALLLPGLVHLADAHRVAERLLQAIRVPFALAGTSVTITASIGAAQAGRHGRDAATLLGHAQVAMHEAKARGADRSVFPDFAARPATDARPVSSLRPGPQKLRTQDELFDAVQAGNFELLYQPRIRVADGACAGLEALLRWRRGQSVLAPESFLPLARESRLLRAMGCWAVESACRQLESWRSASRAEPTVTVNVDVGDLCSPGFAASMLALLERYRLPPGALRLETAANDLVDYGSELAGIVDHLHRQGVRFGVDGIGATGGVEALAQSTGWQRAVASLPVAAVALDRALVARVDSDGRIAQIAAQVFGAARAAGCSTIAVGVERATQLQALQDLGCDEAQGFLLAMPMQAEQAGLWVERRRGAAAAPGGARADSSAPTEG